MVGLVRIFYLSAAFSCIGILLLLSAVPSQITGISARHSASDLSCESLESRKDNLRQKLLTLERKTRSDTFDTTGKFRHLLTRLERVNKRAAKAKGDYLRYCLGASPLDPNFIEGSAVAANMLANPDFENGLTGWHSTSGVTLVASPVHAGQGGLKITASRRKPQQIQQDLAVAAQESYYSAVWVLNPGNVPLYVSVNWYNTQISPKANALANLIGTAELKLNTLASTTEWKLYDGNLSAPSGAVTGRLRFMTPKSQTEAGVYLDDAMFGLNILPPTAAPSATPSQPSPQATSTISADPTISPIATSTPTLPSLPTLAPTRTHTRIPTITATATSAVPPATPLPTPNGSQWSSPLGIPRPSFGIDEVAPAYNQSSPLHIYVSGPANCSDGNNSGRGSPSAPRCTIPRDLAAGSVVEVRGGPYTFGNLHGGTTMGIIASGSASQPVFVRGLPSQRPLMRNGAELYGTYLILENFDFDNSNTKSLNIGPKLDVGAAGLADRIVVRNCDIHGIPPSAPAMSAVSVGREERTAPFVGQEFVSNVVLYNNSVHDNGDWSNAAGDQDVGGITVAQGSSNVWVLDNTVYHASGDGIGLPQRSGRPNSNINHVYIGRNHIFENKQGGVWVKNAQDIIVSQNVMHTFRPSDSSPGHCMGGQYEPERVWFIFNHAFDSYVGVQNAGIRDLYVIGNIFHNHKVFDPNRPGEGARGVYGRNSPGVMRIINNTISDTNMGILIDNGINAVEIVNNIALNYSSGGANESLNTNLFGVNPLFADADGADNIPGNLDDNFRLQAASQAIDSGSLHASYAEFQSLYGIDIAKDTAGVSRPQGVRFDIGAFEY